MGGGGGGGGDAWYSIKLLYLMAYQLYPRYLVYMYLFATHIFLYFYIFLYFFLYFYIFLSFYLFILGIDVPFCYTYLFANIPVVMDNFTV